MFLVVVTDLCATSGRGSCGRFVYRSFVVFVLVKILEVA